MKLEGVKNSNYNCLRVLNAQNQKQKPKPKEKICIKVRQTLQPNLISKHEISGISNDKLQLTSAQSMIVKNPIYKHQKVTIDKIPDQGGEMVLFLFWIICFAKLFTTFGFTLRGKYRTVQISCSERTLQK